jgi:hypothetical protein
LTARAAAVVMDGDDAMARLMTFSVFKPLIPVALLTSCGGGASRPQPDAGSLAADAPAADAPPPDAGPVTFGELTAAVVSTIPQPHISITMPIQPRSTPSSACAAWR